MKALRLCLPLAAALLATFLATNAFATKEMAKTEKKACKACHDMTKGPITKEKPNLNADGQAYKDKLPKK